MTPRPIVVQNVSKTYGPVRALERISFSLPEGVIFALFWAPTARAKRP